ncbi:MAG: hypothetical protein ACRD0U_13450 [Acidimicrobiales bacterium]
MSRPDLRDVYDDGLALADRLQKAGHEAASTDIRDAILGGATSGEITMALNWHLRRLAREPSLDRETRTAVRRLRRQLKRTLLIL